MKKLVMILLVVALIAGAGYCAYRYINDIYIPNHEITDAADEQRAYFDKINPTIGADADETSSGASKAPSAFESLKAQSNDAVGWIKIDGTVIDYPVVQTTDNSFYLNNGFDKEYNGVGCPFLDYRCKSDFSSFVSIVYAHHIQGYQAMFADITRYADSSFMEAYPYGVLLTKTGVHRVRFFAYMLLPNPSFAYQTEQETKSDREGYIDEIFDQAAYTRTYTAQELKNKKDLHLLLLSTCSYEAWNARGVLAGVIE